MGQAPLNAGVSVRSFNRNFEGRSGTKNAQVYLASPEVCAAAAIAGEFVDPRTLGEAPPVTLPDHFRVDDRMIAAPAAEDVEVVRGPNMKPIPTREALDDAIEFDALLKVGDNITTDHISPAGAKYLPLRSNVPALSEHVFEGVDPSFAARAMASHVGHAIIGGDNYGQGSSREHAAMCPLFLGIQAVLATSFARIHKANLINFGIMPLEIDRGDYEALQQGDSLRIERVREGLGEGVLTVQNVTQGTQFEARLPLSERQQEVLLAGGMLNYVKTRSG